MVDPDEGWYVDPEKGLDSLLVPVSFEDLIAIEDPARQLPFYVACNRCGGRVYFYRNENDIHSSEYECNGRLYSYANTRWESCRMSWNRRYTHMMKLADLRAYMSVKLFKTKEKRFRLCLEEHKGTTAYHYVREMTEEESWEEQKDTLEQVRQAIRTGKA